MLRVKQEERLKEGGEREKDAPENAKHGSGAIISGRAPYRIAPYGRFARRIGLQKFNFSDGLLSRWEKRGSGGTSNEVGETTY